MSHTEALSPVPAAVPAPGPTRRILAAELNLERTLEWITRFDNKSSIVLGAATGMLGILATFAPRLDAWTIRVTLAALASAILLATALVFVFLGTYPRTRSPRESLLYFGAVGVRSTEAYRSAFQEQDRIGYLADLVGQCHRNSVILVEKFRTLKAAYVTLFAAFLPWALALLLFRSATA